MFLPEKCSFVLESGSKNKYKIGSKFKIPTFRSTFIYNGGKKWCEARYRYLHGRHHVPETVGTDDEELVPGGEPVVADLRHSCQVRRGLPNKFRSGSDIFNK